MLSLGFFPSRVLWPSLPQTMAHSLDFPVDHRFAPPSWEWNQTKRVYLKMRGHPKIAEQHWTAGRQDIFLYSFSPGIETSRNTSFSEGFFSRKLRSKGIPIILEVQFWPRSRIYTYWYHFFFWINPRFCSEIARRSKKIWLHLKSNFCCWNRPTQSKIWV